MLELRHIGIIFLIFCFTGVVWSLSTHQIISKPDDWGNFLTKQLPFYELPNVSKKHGITILRPTQKLMKKEVQDKLGKPLKTIRVVRHFKDGEDRPIVYTLHIYKKYVFVEADLSPIPGTIVLVLIK